MEILGHLRFSGGCGSYTLNGALRVSKVVAFAGASVLVHHFGACNDIFGKSIQRKVPVFSGIDNWIKLRVQSRDYF